MPNPFNKLKPAPIAGEDALKFSLSNAKLQKQRTAVFSLPAGYTCPGACDCLAWFDRDENKLKDGPKAEFRCFAASTEAAFTNSRRAVDHNLALLKKAGTREKMALLIDMSLPGKYYHRIRVHANGDFYNQVYFRAWMDVAAMNPTRTFYAYTKSLPIWVANKDDIPKNFVLTASKGGKWDNLIEPNQLRQAVVVFHPDEAAAQFLEIDHDDSHAREATGGDFALLIHGMQAKDSEASTAIKRLKKEGVKFSYSKKSEQTANK